MDKASLKNQLVDGITELKLTSINDEVVDQLLEYIAQLSHWNKTWNLTAIRDPEEMVGKHLLDSLSMVVHINGKNIIDVGTGAGLPGIPLACVFPDKTYTLLDSNSKKTRFIQHCLGRLGIKNVSVENSRVEAYRPPQKFDTLIARAFAPVPRLLETTSHLVSDGGEFLLMTGKKEQKELDNISPPYRLREIRAVQVPNIEGQRHVIKVEKFDEVLE